MTDHVENFVAGVAIAVAGGVVAYCVFAALIVTIQNPVRVARVVVVIGIFALVSYIFGYVYNELDITVDDITSNIMNSIRSLF